MPPRKRLPDHPTGAQLRAARGLLNLSLVQLAEQTGLALNTLKRAEDGDAAQHVVLAIGRLLLRPMLRSVARAKSEELFMAACLLARATSALVCHKPVYKALAGLLVESHERNRRQQETVGQTPG